MKINSLPRQILFLVFAAFLTVQAILWGSLYSVRQAMNAEASRDSQERMIGRLKNLQGQVSLIASDYHNWTDIFLNAQALDYNRLASNYGITAERGDVFQYAEIYDGPFLEPISWREGRGLVPQPGFVDETTREILRDLVSSLDIAERQTVDYFELRDDQLVMFSSSYLLPEDIDLLRDLDLQMQAVALIGKVLSPNQIESVGSEFLMRDLRVVDVPRRVNAVNLPSIGIHGNPVAWLEWYPPTPGTELFRMMSPIMGAVSLIFAGTLYWGAGMLRYRAARLISQEAISFRQARTDALTSLPNRLALQEHLSSIVSDGRLNCALIALDINSFKRINDLVGHDGGDRFLEIFSARLQSLSDDETFAARAGGDEFILVVSSLGPLEKIIAWKCAGLNKIESEQILCNGLHFDATVSKGVALMHYYELVANELQRRADRALYAAKARGTRKAVKYDYRMACDDREHHAIESNLRRAIADGDGFSIAYQPIVKAGEMQAITRYEALARWYCRDLGPIPPDRFVHVAETSGLIVRLGWLLLDLICRDIKGVKDCKFGVNISPVQLMSPGFADQFAARVEASGVRPEQIEVEVTEQIAVVDNITIAHELKALRGHGFSLALDDFGTGFASIGFLTRMSFDVVKIDRSFSKFRTDDMQFERMVRSMIGLAHAMNLKIIAEGIETLEEAECFRDLGADFLQGYYFGKPLQIAEQVELSDRAAGWQ